MTLVVGASGATGSLLVEQLLAKGEHVSVIVRSKSRLPETVRTHPKITIMEGMVLDIDDDAIAELVKGCDAVASCLGHNMTFKGMFGHPRRLVSDTLRKGVKAAESNAPEKPIRIALMSTSGYHNGESDRNISFAQKLVIGIMRFLLPPLVDNEKAADYLRKEIGPKHKYIEWVAVRPDGLVDEDAVSAYEAFPTPIRSAIFDAGTVSRINVANFMANLITDPELWSQWKGQMPVLYSQV